MYLALLGLALVLSACTTPTTDPVRLPAGQWALDPGHTSVSWQVRHMGLTWYRGRFDRSEAILEFNPANPASASLTAVIDATSVSTGNPEFDSELAEDWFHSDRHPQIVFQSAEIMPIDATHGRVNGTLSMNGNTRPVSLEVEFYGGVFNLLEGRQAIGFSARTDINRTEFGIGSLPASIVGDVVRIHIETEFLKEAE